MPATFSSLKSEKYVNLETKRKNGTAIATPVWFAVDGDTVYVISEADAGKLKRIRNNPSVRLAACSFDGKQIRGEWIEGTATIIEGQEAARGDGLLDQKYWMKRVGNLFQRWKKPRVWIAIKAASR